MNVFKKYRVAIIIIILALMAYHFFGGQKQNDKILNDNQNSASEITNTQTAATYVVVANVAQQVVNDRLNAIGTGKAVSSVDVRPWSSGMMKSLFVKAGDKVQKHDAMAELDSDNEKISVERAKIQLDDAQLALDRTLKLRQSNTASAVQELSANLTLENTKLALKDAQLALERRTIRAPIRGIVGILPIDAGNYVTADSIIGRIDNRDKILIDLWLPERFAPLVQIGNEFSATSIARPGESFVGHIKAIDNMIDATSRTLRVQGEINNDNDVLQAGMSFAVSLHFPGDTYPSVDPLAIQWGGDGAYVWRVKDLKAERVPVKIIQRNSNSVLVNAKLLSGEKIIVQGVQNIHNGSIVKIQNPTEASLDLTTAPQQAPQ